jgi:hypothetical protein
MNTPSPLARKIFGCLFVIFGTGSFVNGRIARAPGEVLVDDVLAARIAASLVIIAGIYMVIGGKKN